MFIIERHLYFPLMLRCRGLGKGFLATNSSIPTAIDKKQFGELTEFIKMGFYL